MTRRARGRILSKDISISEQVNALSLKTALLFSWMLTHCDDAGRLSGKPSVIKAVVVPMRSDIDIPDIKAAINEMEEQGLIIHYNVGETELRKGELAIQFTGWYGFQMLRDPAPSKIPPPPGWTDQPGRQRDELGHYQPNDRNRQT